MTELLSPSLVKFHGNNLLLVEHEGEPYVPMKPIVEGMGLSWQGQHAKLSADPKRWGIKIILIPTDSGAQDTLCMHLRKLPSWLSQLNPKKVKPENRESVILYRDECDEALWNYWTKGRAERHPPTAPLPLSTADDRKPLRAIVHAWHTTTGTPHQALWGQVRAHFSLGRIDDLPAAWIPDAIAFVQARIDAAPQRALPAPTAPIPMSSILDECAGIMSAARRIEAFLFNRRSKIGTLRRDDSTAQVLAERRLRDIDDPLVRYGVRMIETGMNCLVHAAETTEALVTIGRTR